MDGGSPATVPAAGGSAREARRRKILDRGSDRLAFITGQARSVPPPSAEPTPTSDRKETRKEAAQPKVDLPPSHKERELTDESTMKSTVTDTGVRLLPKCEITDAPKTNVNSERLAHPVVESSSGQRSVAASLSGGGPRKKTFTAGRISYCISSTENVRLVCAAAIAFLVILSSYRGSLFGSKMAASFISFRPIFLVLLTDITLVIALLLTDRELPVKDDDANQMAREEFDLGELIRLVLLVQKAMSAAFTDCCLCLVLVIIGIPFGKNL